RTSAPPRRPRSTRRGRRTGKSWRRAPRTDGTAMLILKGHTAPVRCVAYSPDGRYLASGGDDHAVIVWDLAQGKKLATLHGHADWVRAVAFTCQEGRIATGGWDSQVNIWTFPAGPTKRKPLSSVALHDWVWAVAYAPDGWALAAGLNSGEVV